MLHLDGPRDARAAEDMLAVGDDGRRGHFVAYCTLFLTLNVEPQGFLEQSSVLVVEDDDVLVFKELKQICDTLPAECPVIAANISH